MTKSDMDPLNVKIIFITIVLTAYFQGKKVLLFNLILKALDP
jgi:hypothetical protein